MTTPKKYFAGYCPTPHEKSVVLGGALVLYPLTDPVAVASTLHVYTQKIWEAAYQQGVNDTKKDIRRAIGVI